MMTILRLHLPAISMLLLILTMLSAQAVNAKTPRSEIVPYEQWNCGASDFDKSLSHQLSKEDCPKRMYEADLCCVVHDICYMDDKKSQSDCDAAFCHCLDRTVAQAGRTSSSNQTSPNGCDSVSNSFCEIVKLFGGMAFATARKTVEKQRMALAEWDRKEAEAEAAKSSSTTASTPVSMSSSTPPPALSSTITSTTTGSSTSPSTTPSPAEIGHFVTHKFPLTCLDETLTTCTKQLQTCTSQHFNAAASAADDVERGDALVLGAQLAECSAQFCECAASHQQQDNEVGKQQPGTSSRWILMKKLGAKQGDECAQSLASICTQFVGDKPVQGTANVNFWSINVNYIGQPVSLMLAMVGTIATLFLIAILGFSLLKLVAFVKRRLQMDESIRKNYAKTSIRRNTLTALRSVGGANEDVEHGMPHYMPFGHQKESTVSSPSESEPASQKLLANGHGHKKMHHNNLLQLHSPQHNKMPLNSSQVHLIAGTGNSSSTLSDISAS